MFFIIWGTHTREEPLGEVGDWCPECHAFRAFTVARQMGQPHVYWIPVGRWSLRATFRRCWDCGSTYHCDERDYDELLTEDAAGRLKMAELIAQTNTILKLECDEELRREREAGAS